MTAYAALAEPPRREILDLLRDGERPGERLVDAARAQPARRLQAPQGAARGRARRGARRGKRRCTRCAPSRSPRSTMAGALPRVLVGAPRRPRTTPGGEPMTDGTLETIDGRPALRFERRLAHSVERVWRAVTEPAELERWFVAAGRLDARGGRDVRGLRRDRRDDRGRRAASARLDLGRRALQLRARPEATAACSSSPTSSTTARARRAARCRLGDVPHAARGPPRRRLPLRRGRARALRRAPRALPRSFNAN